MDYKDYAWKNSYNSLDNNPVEEFYKPAISNAIYYKRISGYFSPKFLENLAKEINVSKENNNLYIQILCSPDMSEQDLSDIQLGYDIREKITKSIRQTINLFKEDSEILPYISKLIADKVLDIRFVITDNLYGMFHDKKGIFADKYDNKISFTGSNNETVSAAYNNYESFVVLPDWTNSGYVSEIEQDFDLIWEGNKKGLSTYQVKNEITTVIQEKIGPTYSVEKKIKYPKLEITDKYNLYEYQQQAVREWVNNGYQGLLEMATGTGKTVTALACLEKLSERFNKLLTVIVVPQNELLYQWDEDIRNSGSQTLLCFSGNTTWERTLKNRIRAINHSKEGYFNVIVTRDTFTSKRFLDCIKIAKFESLLISDEVHTFGSDSLRSLYDELNKLFSYKLGVSATPFRKSDSETKHLVRFFDKVVFSYTLKEAIQNGYLNEYEYYPKLLFFNSESLRNYRKVYHDNKDLYLKNNPSAVREIERVTSTIINSSTSKVELLINDLQDVDKEFQGIVYCSPGGYNDTIIKYEDSHIEHVSKELGKLDTIQHRIIRSQVNPEERQVILNQYKNKDLNTLLAIKCLDQGVNLKGVTNAYILSSTDSETEFIQRRGRILRIEKGKPVSKIIDYVMLPQDYRRLDVDIDESDIYIVLRELKRMKSYMDGANNEEITINLIKEIEEVYKEYLEELEYEFSQ